MSSFFFCVGEEKISFLSFEQFVIKYNKLYMK